MHHTVLRTICIIIGLISLFAIGLTVYFRYFMFTPDKNGMEASCFLLRVTPYNSGTNEYGKPVGYGEGESREYPIASGDVFYEDFGDVLVQNPPKSEAVSMIGLLLEVISLDADSVTFSANQQEYTVACGEEFVIYSLLTAWDGASTSYRMELLKP